MAQTSGFFNALLVDNEYDRKYNANDYSDNLAVVIGNGVRRSENDDLKVTASGMVATVAAGYGWINGHYYHNSTPHSFAATTAPIGGSRYDRIMLRLNSDVSSRSIQLVYVEGTAANTPVKPAPTRSGSIYDLVLCDIYVPANATSIQVTDTRSDATICGWVFGATGNGDFFRSLDNSFMEWFNSAKNTLSSVTLFKRYTETQTLASTTSTVTFNIPQYDAGTCFVEVYVNGIFDTRHTISGSVITFTGSLVGGTKVTINVYKSIDGTGIMSVSDEITQLQQQFATLNGISKKTYTCTGTNDNVSLSEIAQAINTGSYTVGSLTAAAEAFLSALGGNTYLAALASDATVTINVAGSLGVTTPFGGSGTAASRYRWFAFGTNTGSQRKIVFDFAKCDLITVTCAASTDNIIFYGTDLNVRNANVSVLSAGNSCAVAMAVGSNNWGSINFENCRLNIRTTGKAFIANNGNFRDCYCGVKSANDDAFCFDAKNDGICRLHGGTYFAYTGSASKTSSVTNINSTEANAVITAENIVCPTIAQTGYTQKWFLTSNGGMTQMIGVTTILTGSGSATYRNIVGKIEKNKY